jgi:hypothetical protein
MRRLQKAIFQSWKKKLGEIDEADELRVSLLTGIDKRNPFSYRVVIGTDVDLQRGKSTRISTVARVNQMYPKSSQNLDGFLERFNRFKQYIIAPGRYISESDAPVFFPEFGIVKGKLYHRPVWQIGENDQDLCGLEPDDQPIVPEGVTDAPVFKALEQLRLFESKRQD